MAKADPDLVGYWVEEYEGLVSVFDVKLSKDGRCYEVLEIECEGTLRKPTKLLGQYRATAWLTAIEGVHFVTCKVADDESWPEKHRERLKTHPYTIEKIEIAKDKVVLTSLRPEFEPFASAKTRGELEAAVAKNLKNPDAFDFKSEFKRAKEAEVKEVLKLAETEKR